MTDHRRTRPSAGTGHRAQGRDYRLVGLATAVSAVVARVDGDIALDGAVPGEIQVGRGGMVCSTLAAAAAIGVPVAGVIASGDDTAGSALREKVAAEGVDAAFVMAAWAPMTVTLAAGTARSSVMGVGGEREQHLEPEAVRAAWIKLAASPAWVLLTLPALDSPAGAEFAALARSASASVAVTLSSAGHVTERSQRVGSLLADVDLVFGNAAEEGALRRAGADRAHRRGMTG